MTKAEVIELLKDDMRIKILEHSDVDEIGETYSVINSNKKFELTKAYEFTKKDLKDGDIVTLRNGDKLIYCEDDKHFADLRSTNSNYLSYRHELNDDLTYNDSDENSDIVKVERPVEYDVVYTRGTKEIKKMTVAEICKELGYDVEIVKEEK